MDCCCCLEESADIERDLPQAAEAGQAVCPFALQTAINEDERREMRDAADEGYALAMYDYGSCGDDPRHKVQWLMTAACERDLRAMYLLAFECDDPGERRHWLQMAAAEGYAPAMCDLGLLCDNRNKKQRWLEEAAASGWLEAKLG